MTESIYHNNTSLLDALPPGACHQLGYYNGLDVGLADIFHTREITNISFQISVEDPLFTKVERKFGLVWFHHVFILVHWLLRDLGPWLLRVWL